LAEDWFNGDYDSGNEAFCGNLNGNSIEDTSMYNFLLSIPAVKLYDAHPFDICDTDRIFDYFTSNIVIDTTNIC